MATVKKIKKAQTGKIQARGTSGDYYNIDTAGYSAGAKKFPAEVVRPRIIGKAKKLAKDVSRRKVDEAIKNMVRYSKNNRPPESDEPSNVYRDKMIHSVMVYNRKKKQLKFN